MSSEQAGREQARRRRSHHWYWVAAIPSAFLLWLGALAWLAVASSWEAFGFSASLVNLSLVALGVPFVFLTAYFPIAVYKDAAYVNQTSGKWAPEPMRQALTAGIGLAVLLVGGFLSLAFEVPPTFGVVAGFVASVPFAAYYLWRRHEMIGTPDIL